MEAFLALVGLGLSAWILLGPLVVLLRLRSVREELGRVRRDLGDLSGRLHEAERQLAVLASARGEERRPPASRAPEPDEAREPKTAPDTTPLEPSVAKEASHAPNVVESAPDHSTTSVAGQECPPETRPSLEQTIGVVWLTRVGASAVLLGTAYFFKYAVDNDWIGPWPRIALGAVAGTMMLAAAERSRPKANRIWADLVTGLGLGLLLFAAYASYAFYALVPVGAAFAAFVVVACLGGALAVLHGSETILVFSLAAACSAPALLSTGTDRPLALFGYLLVVTGLSHAAALHRRFRIALWLGLIGPAALFAAWYDRFFDIDGAYVTLSSRAAPLASVALFLVLWLVVHGRARRLPKRRTDLVAWYAAAASTAAFASLLYDKDVLFGTAMAALGAVFAALAERDGTPMLLVVSLGATAAAWLALPARSELRLAFIGTAALWAAVHFAAAANGLLGRSAETDHRGPRARLLAAAGSGIGFVAVAFQHGLGGRGTLAAAILAVVGAADLALGAALVKRRGSTAFAAAPLGLALGLFAASIAFLFAGPVVTIAWAALGATVVGLAALRGDRLWLLGGLAVFVATSCRLVAVDWDSAAALRAEFVASAGLRGSVEPPVLLNERAYALFGTGVALLAAARLAKRSTARAFRYATAALGAAAHAAFLALLVVETRNAAAPAITVPRGRLEPTELYALLNDHERQLVAAAHRLSMITTLVLGVYAAILVSIGFGAREPGHRYLGLALFAATLGKLVFFDVWELERVYQILILVGVGVLLLGASFLYARFGGRLFKILGGGGSAAALCAALSMPSPAWGAVDPHAFAQKGDVSGVVAPGLYRFDVVAPLYRASRTQEPLDDVRIVGPNGAETPYFVRSKTEPPTGRHAASMLDPVTFPDGRVRATFDLGVAPVRHGGARLSIDGDDFLRRTEIEVSDDGKEFAEIQTGRVVYRASDGAKPAESLDVIYPASAARYVRITLLPGSGNVVGFLGAEFSLPETAPPPVQGFPIPVLRTDRSAAERTTLVVFDVGAPGIPIETIRLELETENFFQRQTDVLAASDAVHWFAVGGGFLYRIPIANGKTAESFALGAGGSRKRYFAFRFHDGDDTPLAVRTATVEYIPQEIVFRASSAGPHRVLVGSASAARPAYDLGTVVVRGVGEQPKSAAILPLEDNPDFVDPQARPTFSEKYGRYFAAALTLVVVGLGWFTFKLLRRIQAQ